MKEKLRWQCYKTFFLRHLCFTLGKLMSLDLKFVSKVRACPCLEPQVPCISLSRLSWLGQSSLFVVPLSGKEV
jgi:hypothetical protein